MHYSALQNDRFVGTLSYHLRLMRERYFFVVVLVLVGFGTLARGAGQNSPGSSRSVWDGVFTAEQATRGSTEFQENCASCHGPELQGTADAKALKGDRFWADWKESTVDYL